MALIRGAKGDNGTVGSVSPRSRLSLECQSKEALPRNVLVASNEEARASNVLDSRQSLEPDNLPFAPQRWRSFAERKATMGQSIALPCRLLDIQLASKNRIAIGDIQVLVVRACKSATRQWLRWVGLR